MTTQLIPVFNGTIANESTLLCNARELHEFLAVGRDFSNWIRERISEYGFTANIDYIVFSPNSAKTPGRKKKDYHLTLDTAKELAMVERNEQGRKIRRYFIECEKQLRDTNVKKIAPTVSQEERDAYNVNALMSHYRLIYTEWKESIYPALKKLESPLASRLCNHYQDGFAFLMHLEKSLNSKLTSGQRPRIY